MTFVIDPTLMMAPKSGRSTRDTYNYGQYINQFLPNTIKVIREFERIQKKICKHKAWTPIDRLSIIWKSNLTDKMKRSFFQAVVVSILLLGCTTWTLIKRLEKKLDGNIEQVQAATLHKAPTVRSPTTYHGNYTS